MMNKQRANLNILIISILLGIICCIIVICVSFINGDKNQKTAESVTHTHNYDEWNIVKNPDCTNDGLRERYCSCGDRQASTIAALGHELVSFDEVAASCTENGHKEYVKCLRCDYGTYEEILALGHDFGEWEVQNEATCYSLGLEIRVCSRDHMHVDTRPIEKKAHSVEKWTVIKAATCTENGEQHGQCSVCHAQLIQTIDALGHNFGEWEVITEPTCTENGFEIRVCSTDESHIDSRQIESKGHSSTSRVVVKAASCTEDGVEYIVCTICSTSIDKRTIYATGHSPTDWIVDNEAECEVDGLKHIECETCGTKLNTEIIDALGHDIKIQRTATNHILQCSRCLTVESNEPHMWDDNDCKVCGYDAGGIKGLEWKISADGEYYIFNGFGKAEQSDDFNIPEIHNGKKVTAIGEDAFRQFNGKSIVIPFFIEYISCASFAGCRNLEKLTLPFIGESRSNSLNLGWLFGADSFERNPKYIPLSLKALEILDGITEIFNETFKNCISIEKIILPNSIEVLGEDAFYGCTSLKEVVLSANLKSIDDCAFWNCTSLKEIALPESLQYIGSGVFGGCDSLDSIEIPANVKEIGRNAFLAMSENFKIVFRNKTGWALYDGEDYYDSLDKSFFDEDNTDEILKYSNKYTYKCKTVDGE